MTYAEQLQIIKDIKIREGDAVVIPCPFCYGEKKLALSKMDGKLMWNCYRASCEGKGIYSGKRNLSSAKNYLGKKVQTREVYKRPLPLITTSIENHLAALNYLDQVNSLEAYQNGFIKVRYDPSDDRVIFYSGTGAVGRSLRGFGAVKWITYGKIHQGVHIGVGKTAVLVEDIPSACSVSRIDGLVGVALLGTNLTSSINNSLNFYNDTYLCLDKDALTKAIVIKRRINSNIKVRLTSVDLKLLTKDKIEELLE